MVTEVGVHQEELSSRLWIQSYVLKQHNVVYLPLVRTRLSGPLLGYFLFLSFMPPPSSSFLAPVLFGTFIDLMSYLAYQAKNYFEIKISRRCKLRGIALKLSRS